MTQKKVTITDIAKAAGVSKTTISRYLNGRFDLMSPETRRRIESVIDVSGYQPSTIARSLKNKRSLLLGIVVSDQSSPFSTAVLLGVGDALRNTEGDEVRIQLNGPLSPMKIMPREGNAYLFLVLPVRLKSE